MCLLLAGHRLPARRQLLRCSLLLLMAVHRMHALR